MYTAVIMNSVLLANTTRTATFPLFTEANYSCIASSKYGTDVKNFSVIFNGKSVLILICSVSSFAWCQKKCHGSDTLGVFEKNI